MEIILCNQPAHKVTGCSSREWFHIRDLVLVSTADRLAFSSGHSQTHWPPRREVYVPESMYNLHPCHHGQFVHEPTEQYKSSWRERLYLYLLSSEKVPTEWVFQSTWLFKSSSSELILSLMIWFVSGTRISLYFLCIQRCLSTCLFSKFSCHFLVIQPNH